MARRVAIVTGGTGGLGQTVVREFLTSGTVVAIPVSGDTKVDSSSRFESETRILILTADLRNEAAVKGLIARVAQDLGGVDYLVNLAGGYAGGNLLEDTSLEEWERMMDLNLTTAFLMTRGVLPLMKSRHFGRIINISAMPALLPSTRRSAYAISKKGIAALTEVTHEEVKGSGITVNAIAPSIIVTDANRKSMPNADLSLWVTPEEISRLIQYLCSPEARSISGNVLRVFGGL
jgi:NAD(P)-dependent dehydrogenase (short-subunit alcohol dehydrogenase family)